MWKIFVTIILTSMFFVLFFEQYLRINDDDINSKNKVSTTDGFIEDTRDAFIMPMYPTQLLVRDETGKIQPTYGDIGTFVPYSSVPEDHWLHGFPHEKA